MSVEELAQVAGFSKFHFDRIFKIIMKEYLEPMILQI